MNGKLNGARDRFDKLARRGDMMKAGDADDALRVLRKVAPAIARQVERLDETFAALLAKLGAIETTHEGHIRIAPRLAPAREPNPDDVLEAMRVMGPDARAQLLSKLKQ